MPRINRPSIVQVSASLLGNLGGPPKVIEQTFGFFFQKYDSRLIIFGDSEFDSGGQIVNSTFLNNRYGFRFRRPSNESIQILRRSEIVLIHGFYLYSTLLALYFTKSKNIFLMPHGSLEIYQQRNGRFRKKIFDYIFKILSFRKDITFLVASLPEVHGVRFKFSKSTVKVVGLGTERVSTNCLHSVSDDNEVKLLSFSRISRIKRIDLCILAVHELRKRGINVHLTIAGSGDTDLALELQELVINLNLSPYVKFIGFVDGEQKHFYFKNTDIFLLPSENENFAIAVAESISHQVPVVVSSHVAMKDFVSAYSTGEVMKALEVSDLVAAILKIDLDYLKYWKNCQKYKDKLSWESVLKNWEKELFVSLETSTHD